MRAAKPIVDSTGTRVFVHNPSNFLSPMVFTSSSKTCFFLPTMTTPPTVVDNGDQRRKSECDRKTLKVQETAGGQECAVSEDETQSGSLPIKSVGPNLYVALAAAHFKLHHGNNHPSEQHTEKKQNIRCLA